MPPSWPVAERPGQPETRPWLPSSPTPTQTWSQVRAEESTAGFSAPHSYELALDLLPPAARLGMHLLHHVEHIAVRDDWSAVGREVAAVREPETLDRAVCPPTVRR